jgi:hypothetical protein
MKIIKSKPYNATITIGLQKGYSDELYSKKSYLKALQSYQKELSIEKNIYLSACVLDCLIVLNNQLEPHLKIEFINYPKFPLKKDVFKSNINSLGEFLMSRFEQNRIVINYQDETLMFEIEDKVDFRIN